MDDRPNGHRAEMGGGPAAGDVSDLFRQGAGTPAVSGLFSSADMASGPSGQDDWERGAGSAVSAPVNQLQISLLEGSRIWPLEFCCCRACQFSFSSCNVL